MAELEMLPEWAGRKAALTPSPADQVDETAPMPVVAPVARLEEPAPEVEEVTADDVGPEVEPTVEHAGTATPTGDFAQSTTDTFPPRSEEDNEQLRAERSGRLLALMALLALVAGIGAGYLYLVLVG
ncbi:MAG: hypothetical protein ACR2QO_00030 [Acidimicrobiales bacterium]